MKNNIHYMLSLFIAMLLMSAIMTGCVSTLEPEGYQTDNVLTRSSKMDNTSIIPKDSAIIEFGKILSKAVYHNKQLREFIKKEAQKEFDMNSDILYIAVKDEYIGSLTFEETLAKYSSKEMISSIESSVPLLNMLVPQLDMFGIYPDNMDCSDPEIPIVIKGDKGMDLYINGKLESVIPLGQLPAFHTIVINENSRVTVNETTRSGDNRYSFISPNYDRSLMECRDTRSAVLSYREVGEKAVKAYNKFNSDDGGKYSKSFQRDFIYYGMSPWMTEGTLNRSVSEYISYMEVNPKLYFFPNDQHDGELYDDPYIIKSIAEREAKDFTEEELISEMWSKGTFNFRFEIFSSNSSIPTVIHIPLKPSEIWNFNYEKEYVHSTWFRHSKYTYKINPDKFTSKPYYFTTSDIRFCKWDLSQEGLERYVYIFEEDKSTSVTRSIDLEITHFTSSKINGSTKFGLGTDIDGNFSASTESSTTKKEKKTFTCTRQEEDDPLGVLKIYFYDPIIEGVTDSKPKDYRVRSYNTGYVQFALSVK